jgi:hypothetical protein
LLFPKQKAAYRQLFPFPLLCACSGPDPTGERNPPPQDPPNLRYSLSMPTNVEKKKKQEEKGKKKEKKKRENRKR